MVIEAGSAGGQAADARPKERGRLARVEPGGGGEDDGGADDHDHRRDVAEPVETARDDDGRDRCQRREDDQADATDAAAVDTVLAEVRHRASVTLSARVQST